MATTDLLTCQVAGHSTERLEAGVAVEEDEANIDYTFDVNEFFAAKDNGFFEH